MPLDIRSQVVTALDNVNKNPELYTPRLFSILGKKK